MKKFWMFFLWALVLRVLCAYFVYGPQALDDYEHGIIPVLNWFHGMPLDLPDYRNPLLTYTLRFWLEVGRIFSIHALVDQIRWLEFGLALLQMSGLYAVWKIFEKESNRAQNLALFLYSSFIIMPFVATRAFGEAVALPLVLIGFMFLMRNVSSAAFFRTLFFGFFFLGIATLYRFQVGIMGVVAFIYLLVAHFKDQKKMWRVLFSAVVAGAVILLIQGIVDVCSDRAFLATLFNYFKVNEGGAAQYGVSPWYNTWLFPLMVFLFPFSWPLFNSESLIAIWKKWGIAIVSVFVFILIHSLVPHKEERFQYPVLGLLLVFLAFLWANNWQHKWVRKVLTPMLFVINGLGVLVVVTSNSQEGVVKPLAEAEKAFDRFLVLETQSLVQESRLRSMFLTRAKGDDSEEMTVSAGEVRPSLLEKIFSEDKFDGVLWVTSEPEVAAMYRLMENSNEKLYHCETVQKASSMIDSVIYQLNPKHNQRRRPSWFLLCSKNLSKEAH